MLRLPADNGRLTGCVRVGGDQEAGVGVERDDDGVGDSIADSRAVGFVNLLVEKRQRRHHISVLFFLVVTIFATPFLRPQ